MTPNLAITAMAKLVATDCFNQISISVLVPINCAITNATACPTIAFRGCDAGAAVSPYCCMRKIARKFCIEQVQDVSLPILGKQQTNDSPPSC